MIDQIFDREYRSARSDLNAALTSGFSRLGRAVGNTFEVLNRIEYNSPWMAKRRKLASQ
ncbi:MAG TPA: hypothetical protein VFW39_01140 [Sphingomicrobium sp.]|nr:hypothetical protein [Sphingomicrobium sp.]